MISKDELIKSVAESCGVSVDISAFFFEVFVNRLSNKLKPGDLLHFQNYGFFHKRNCRIHIDKTSDSPTPKSYLIQLVLFSSGQKINKDLRDIHFLKIANLKTLWIDDKDFQKSLKSGDFAPHTERNQLIKSFATKAEVIISGLRKDYDSDLVEELIIPLTFDLNFLIKSGQRSSSSNRSSKPKLKSEQQKSANDLTDEPKVENQAKPEHVKSNKGDEETAEDGLPWNYGTKFLEKDKSSISKEIGDSDTKPEFNGRKANAKLETDLRKEQSSRLRDFEPVSSHRAVSKKDSNSKAADTVKFSVSQTSGDENEKSSYMDKFTEVKSKTEPYRQRKDFRKSKSERYDKYSKEKAFTARRNYLPIVAVISFIIIAVVVVYIYFIRGDENTGANDNIAFNIEPADNVNVIERDYEFSVSYPYPKMDDRIEISGFNPDLLQISEIKPENVAVKPDVKKKTEPEVKQETKSEKITESKVEVKTEPPVEEKPNVVTKPKEEKSSRIFLYRNFYVVYVGTYKSEDEADREADKYFSLGYNAFIEVIESRGRGREYKLNVGDFTSEEFARQFEEQYIK
jgi:cell division septation protein DedD/nucleoid DNA-binding protein